VPTDSSGNHSLPASYFVQNGDTVLPVQHNPPMEDLSQGLTNRLMKDGRTVWTGDMKAGGFKVTGMAPGEASGDSLNVQQLSDRVDALADFGTVADLLADNNQRIGYAGDGARIAVAPGNHVTAQGSRYEVVASDAVEFDEETAGGVRLKYAITGATRLITDGEVVTISSSDAAVDDNLAILSVNNFDDNSCGLRVRSYWSGAAALPYQNNDGLLTEVYNTTVDDSLNRSWGLSAANAYNDIPVGVTDSGTRVAVQG